MCSIETHVGVVFDDQDFAHHRRGRGDNGGGEAFPRRVQQREADQEFAPLSGPGAGSPYRTAVHFDQHADQRQADAQAALLAVQRRVGLYEQFENALQHVVGDSLSIIADGQQGHALVAGQTQRDLPAGGRELHRVGQQIDLDLLQSRRVAAQPQRLFGEFEDQFLVAPVQLTANRRHRVLERDDQIDVLLGERDLALHDPRDVQQIVEQRGHLLRLPLDHGQGTANGAALRRQTLHDTGGVENRSQRISQFVREHGQELIPLANGLDGQAFRPLLLGDVAGDVNAAQDRPVRAVDRRHGHEERAAQPLVVDLDGVFRAAGQQSRMRTKHGRRVRVVNHLEAALSDQLFRAAAHPLGHGFVRPHDAVLVVQNQD